jgi:hypothetical protein
VITFDFGDSSAGELHDREIDSHIVRYCEEVSLFVLEIFRIDFPEKFSPKSAQM